MLLPVLAGAKTSAQKTQAKMEEIDIVTAIQQYDSAYGRFPVSAAAQSAGRSECAGRRQSGFHLWRHVPIV